MIGWKQSLGKKVYIELKRGGHPYSGKVTEVDESLSPHLVFITIIDKFGKRVVFCHVEFGIFKEES